MVDQTNLKKFNRVYDETYSEILKYVIIKCYDINDANDIIQDIYFELWKILNKKDIDLSNIKSYLIGIAINKIKKHYTLLQRIKTISIFSTNDDNIELIDTLESPIDLEDLIIKESEWDEAWDYIKSRKNKNIPKIFYLYYILDLSIKDISKELIVSQSYVKNVIYRTLKELRSLLGKGCN